MTEFKRRDVRLIIDKVREVEAMVANLAKLTVDRQPGRLLALANTHSEVTRLYLNELAAEVPEVVEG